MNAEQLLIYLLVALGGSLIAASVIYSVIRGLLRSLRGTMIGANYSVAPQGNPSNTQNESKEPPKSSNPFGLLSVVIITFIVVYMAFGHLAPKISVGNNSKVDKEELFKKEELPLPDLEDAEKTMPKADRQKSLQKKVKSNLVYQLISGEQENGETGFGLQLIALSNRNKVGQTLFKYLNLDHRARVFRNKKGHYCITIVGFFNRDEATRYKQHFNLKATEVDLEKYLTVFSNSDSKRVAI